MKTLFNTIKIIFIVSLFLFTSSVYASNFLGQNSLDFSDLSISQPNDRWRVLQNTQPDIVQFKYLKHGKDILIKVSKKEAVKKLKLIGKPHYRHWKKPFSKIILEPYQNLGYRFIKFEKSKRDISVIGVDQNQNYLLINFLFKNKKFTSDFYVIETTLSTAEYLKFKDDFYTVVNSVKLK
ncbi:hypothetical protein BVY03_02740 [bacterium K02(2017)]|nr:hypothetical protein BVY03_02740 [bacterium K02(2017)]